VRRIERYDTRDARQLRELHAMKFTVLAAFCQSSRAAMETL